jgi:ABC-2 type transport system ATP-binding protein
VVADGAAVFLTTQYLDEADRLADRISVLDGGKLVAEGTADELKRLVSGGRIELRFADTGDLDTAARVLGGETPGGGSMTIRDENGLTLQIPSDGGVGDLKALLGHLERCGVRIEGLAVHTPDLDDVFLALTEKTGRTSRTAANPKASR